MTFTSDKEKERQRRNFELMFQAFVERWAPEHPRDRDEFHRELHFLLAQTYQDAQAPVLDQLGKVAMLCPLPPIIVKEP